MIKKDKNHGIRFRKYWDIYDFYVEEIQEPLLFLTIFLHMYK